MRGAGCVAGRREDVGANPGGDSAVGGSSARLEEAEGGAAFLALGDSGDACRAFGGGCMVGLASGNREGAPCRGGSPPA